MKKLFITSLLLFGMLIMQAQQKDYKIYLKSGTEAPSENAKLASIDPKAFQSCIWSNQIFAIVQFYELPSLQTKSLLKSKGVELYEYLPSNSYLAKLNVGFKLYDLNNIGIRSIIPYIGKHKISPELTQLSSVPDHAWQGQNVKLIALNHKGISIDDIKKDISAKFNIEIENHKTRYNQFEITLPFEKISEFADLPYIKFVQAIGDKPKVDNRNTDSHHHLGIVHSTSGSDLKGDGVTIAIGDNGYPNENLIDFHGRITNLSTDFPTSTENHGIHVMGIATGAGNFDERYQGVAPNANIIFASYNDATAQVDVNPSIVVTSDSHSGYASCSSFGVYNAASVNQDQRINGHPYLLECWSAGNSNSYPCDHPEEPEMWNVNGGEGAAKNTLVVGCHANPQSWDYYNIGNFYSKGPTADGRIKPEITALGKQTSCDLNNSYGSKTGTSQATPAVSGTAVLLYEQYKKNNGGANPDGALIKAILCNTADDMTNGTDNSFDNPGPDFTGGFGYLNARRAVEAVKNNWYTSLTLDNGGTQDVNINVPSNTGKLKVMICWNDPAAAANATTSLVNDMDLEVYNPSSTKFLPWVLDTNHVQNNAVRGVDNVNNIEQVTIDNPTSGNYTIRVKGSHVPSGPQKVNISYYFVDNDMCFITYPGENQSFLPGEEIMVGYDFNQFKDHSTEILEITYDDGANWSILWNGFNLNSKLKAYRFDLPSNIKTGKAKLRLTIGSNTAESEYFSIMDIPLNIEASFSENGSTGLKWSAVAGATNYEVWKLGEKYFEYVGTTSSTNYTANGIDHSKLNYFSVKAIGPNNAVSRRSRPFAVGAGQFSASDLIIAEFPFKESFEEDADANGIGSFMFRNDNPLNDFRFINGVADAKRTDTGPKAASDGSKYTQTYIQYPNGDNLYIESPSFDFNVISRPRVSFDYHMYGDDMGSLALEISEDNGASWNTIFSKSGDQGDRWYMERIDLASYKDKFVRFRFKATLGNSYHTEIGLDNFVVDQTPLTEAEFVADYRNVALGANVQFTNFSSEDATSYYWTFEGGSPSTSTLKDPVVSFNTFGYKTVSLTITNSNGTDTETKHAYIMVGDYCIPSGVGNSQYGWINEFSIGDYKNISHAGGYEDYSLREIIPVKSGLVDISILKKYLYNRNTYVKIWMDLNSDGDFNDTDELIFDQGSASLNDITAGKASIPTSAEGIVTRMRVSLNLYSAPEPCENYFGEVEDYTVKIISGSSVNPPVANFTASTTNIDEGSSINFADGSTNNPTSWLWTFEGGTPVTSTLENPTVTYNTPGNYDVTLQVTNADGSDTEVKTNFITVNQIVQAPVANFSADNTDVAEGSTINFTDESGNSPTSWSWSFDGGTPSTSNAQNPSVTYNSPGTYEVSLTATNAGGSDSETKSGYITVGALPVASFSGCGSVTEGNSIAFTNSSTDATSYSWTFPGGSPASSTAETPTVTYGTAGTYDVTLTVTNAYGSDTETSTGCVVVSAPVGFCSSPISTFPYAEGFETQDAGSFEQDANDDFDWETETGTTRSSSTGPSSAKEGDHYLYTESSNPNYPTKTAIIYTPCFDISGLSNPTFSFDYHMYGSSMGTMLMEITTDGSNYSSIFTKSGDQGNQWFSESIDLSSYSGIIKIKITGTTANSYRSDMALDNIKLENGSAPDTQAPSVPTGLASANVTTNSFDISWEASTDNVGVTGYDVYKDGAFDRTVAGTTASFTSLSENTTYSITIKAKDAAGNISAASSALDVTTTASSNCYESDVTLTLVTDNFGYETTWELKDASGTVVYSNTSGNYVSDTTYTESFQLSGGDYTFTINDSYGDGICCAYGNGSYELKDANGQIIASGGAFTSSESTDFCIAATDAFALGISATNTNSFNLYPNPVNDKLYVEVAETGGEIRIFDAVGTLVHAREIMSTKETINVANYAKGMYTICVIWSEKMEISKFIKN